MGPSSCRSRSSRALVKTVVRSLRYQNTGKGSHNIHVDQLVPVMPKTIYEVQARVRGDGELEPMIAVQTKDWGTLTTVSCGKQTDWHEVRLLFQSFDNELVRFEWFPGAQGRLHTGVAGTSWLDDVSIRPMQEPVTESAALVRTATATPRPGDRPEERFRRTQRAIRCRCGDHGSGRRVVLRRTERRWHFGE